MYSLAKIILHLYILVDEDFSGVPINLTVAGGMASQSIDGPTQSVNVTIFDDNIVEDFESINLRLSAENPDIVVVQQNVAIINIVDNDGMINYMQLDSTMLHMCKYIPRSCVSFLPFSCHY